MKNFSFKALAVLVVASSLGVFLFRGSDARGKWVFKMKERHENRRVAAQRKLIKRRGGVLLDDIEIQAYHS